ncbi:MAG TPA: RraA family protein [Nitriliruptorales bacterium]
MTGGDLLHQRFARWSTSLVSDVLGDVGRANQVIAPTIRATAPVVGTTAGWAFTVAGRVDHDASGPDLVKARAIDAMPAGAFAVWAGGDVVDVCLFGDLLAAAQRGRGVVGALVDGGIRDSDAIHELAFPIWSRYVTPRASTGVWRATDADVAVELPGTLGTTVTVNPGDLVVADGDGAVVVAPDVIEAVAERCDALLAREAAIRSRLDAGESLTRLLQEHGRI